jgi:hypothetical protein
MTSEREKLAMVPARAVRATLGEPGALAGRFARGGLLGPWSFRGNARAGGSPIDAAFG